MLGSMRGGRPPLFVLVCCGALLAACGGKVVQAGNTGTDAGTGTGTDGSSSHALGPCHPGTPVASATSCAWLGSDGLCYRTVDDACNCVCPRNGASVCVSGFPRGDNGRVPVSCN